MIWVLALALTVGVVLYVGYPLFVRQARPEEDELEAAIRRRRGRQRSASAAAGTDDLRCWQCGEEYDEDDRFCAACGTKLAGGRH